MRFSLVLLLGLLSGFSMADDERDAALLDDLLKLAAPPADWREQLKGPDAPREQPPAPDAPIEIVAAFWSDASDAWKPDSGVPPRLLSWCEAHPESLEDLVRWMPVDVTEYHDRLKAILDRLLVPLHPERKWDAAFVTTENWLERHSRYYRAEFIEGVRRDFLGGNGERMAGGIEALARVDPQAAEKVLLQLSGRRDAFTRTAALVWLHALRLAGPDDPRLVRWRAELQKTATHPAAPIRARDYAVTGLMRVPWEGQDEWFLGLFADATLGAFQDKEILLRPLFGVVGADPDRWIPKIAPLAGSANRVIRNNAVRCLSEFTHGQTRADALAPLLPWLSDPGWADLGSDTPRTQVLESLTALEFPAAGPALQQAVERESGRNLAATASMLAYRGVKSAGPALRAALARETSEIHRPEIMRAAAILGAYSVEEMEQAVEALVKKLAADNGPKELEDYDPLLGDPALDPQVLLGSVLWRAPIDNDELARRLLHRADEFAATEPKSAERLRVIVAGWPGDAAADAIAKRFQTGDFTAPWIAQLLARRQAVAAQVTRIEGLRGVSRGVQAAISGADGAVNGVLHGDDRAARLSLLACARHIRLPLPLDAVEPMLDTKDADLARAAEGYLASEDSPGARTAVLRRHPNEALILGVQEGYPYDPEQETAGPIANTERLMRDMVLAEDGGPREILALLSEGFGGDAGQILVLVYADRAVLRWLDGGGRRRERIVPAGELARLRGWLEAQRADNLPLFDDGACDGIQYEYVHLDRNGGRRVFMNNPRGPRRYSGEFAPADRTAPDPSIYGRLVNQFAAIVSPPMEVVYESLRDLPGFRLLHAAEQGKATALAWERGKLVVQVQGNNGLTYHMLGEHGLSADEVKTPHAFRDDLGIGRWKSDFIGANDSMFGPATGRLAGNYLWAAIRGKGALEGIWASDEKSTPRLLIRGGYHQPIPTTDGEWIVALKAWTAPHGVVRIHVADGRVYPVDLPSADRFRPVASLPDHHRILICRVKDQAISGAGPAAGPDEPEFFVVDAASGAVSKPTGDFRPFYDEASRQLQPATQPNEIWAAFPLLQLGTPATIIGRYDAREFKFQPALTVLGLNFTTRDMRVDEANHHVTFIANGDVLRLALP